MGGGVQMTSLGLICLPRVNECRPPVITIRANRDRRPLDNKHKDKQAKLCSDWVFESTVFLQSF